MQTFKNYLAEARDFPIYHGTALSFYEVMIHEGIAPKTIQTANKLLLNPTKSDFEYSYSTYDKHGEENGKKIVGHYYGISTTRNFKFAANWSAGIVIEFNHAEIAKRYKILPIQFYNKNVARFKHGDESGHKNEYEEFIVTRKHIPINSTFIKRIWVHVSEFSHKSFLENIQKITPEGILVETYDQKKIK